MGGTFLGLCADESRGAVCADVPVKAKLFHFPDPSPFLDTRVAPKATGAPTTLYPAVISSLVWLDIDSRRAGMPATQRDDKLACNPRGQCQADLLLPLTRPMPADAVYVCVRSGMGAPLPLSEAVLAAAANGAPEFIYQPLPSEDTTWWADGRAYGYTHPMAPPEVAPPYGGVACSTIYPGAYAVVAYTRTRLPESSQGVNVSKVMEGTRQSYQYTLGADYDAIAANATLWSLVSDFTILAVANATGLPSHHINVTDIRKGSVVVAFDVWVPKAFNTTQASKVDAAVLAPSTGSFLVGRLLAFNAPISNMTVAATAVAAPVLPNIKINITVNSSTLGSGRPVPKQVVYTPSEQGNMTGSVVAGVVSGASALVVFIVSLTMWLVKRRRLQQATAVQPVDDVEPSHHSAPPRAWAQPRTPSRLPLHDMRAHMNPYPSSSAWAAPSTPTGPAMAARWAVPHPA